MHGTALAFYNADALALPLLGDVGHVGWGFAVGRRRYVYGATEPYDGRRRSGLFVRAGGPNPWWIGIGSARRMRRAFRGAGPSGGVYTHVAVLPVPRAHPRRAMLTALATERLGYLLPGNNGVDRARMVLAAYGVPDLPRPWRHVTPRRWLTALPAEPEPL